MKKNFNFYMRTYGCRVNQYESQSIREHWLALGGNETDKADDADIILVSTCAVTSQAVSDARQYVRQISLSKRSRIVVAGCAVTAAPGDFAISGVSAIIPHKDKHMLLNMHPFDSFELPSKDIPWTYPPFRICSFVRSRPIVKVQDGCSQGCAYCIVPFSRGPARSRQLDDIADEIERLLLAGYREITLSGINLRQFHADDLHGKNFWSLLRYLDNKFYKQWRGRARFRLSSLDPSQLVGQEGIETLEQCRMLCPHLHLSLQSGSPGVLKRMRRFPYSPQDIEMSIAKIRRFWPILGLGADFLMGFPGETSHEVNETLELIKKLPFTYAHVFPYSVRPGTQAALLDGQLDKRKKQEHAKVVRALVEEKKKAFLMAQLTVCEMSVAFDGDGTAHGVNEWYADCRMEGNLARDQKKSHELILCEPIRADADSLVVKQKEK